jgi:hypothetical protein
VLPNSACHVGLRVITGEARCESPPCGSLHRGGSGGLRSRRLYSQLLLARQITLLQALLALELALLCLQQPLLRALRPRAFRLLRLQLLHALLQAIDALLALRALARQHVVRALLRGLLPLLGALLALADPLLLRWARVQRGRCARA